MDFPLYLPLQCILNAIGVALDLTMDHKAGDPEVVAEVTRNGGFVRNGRINNLLAVGRAFGDSILKSIFSSSSLNPILTTSF